MEKAHPRILLGMLVSNGDCLFATVLAKQIKADYPGAELTWAVSDLCRSMILNNPYVDHIWEVKLKSKKAGLNEGWYAFKKEAEQKKNAGVFDHLFFTQIYPENVFHFDGTTRGTIYNAYPNPVTVDTRPVVRLTEQEVQHTDEFVKANHLDRFKNLILFECSSFSGQSFVTPQWAINVSEKLIRQFSDLAIILSTHEELPSPDPRIVVANKLTIRENAALTHYCTLFVGCSSGITWMAVSDAAKRLPMVQFLKRGIGFSFASVAYDHEYWRLDASKIIETTKPETDYAVELIAAVVNDGIEKAREKYHRKLKPRFLSLLKYSFMFFRRGQILKSRNIVRNFIRRNYSHKARNGK